MGIYYNLNFKSTSNISIGIPNGSANNRHKIKALLEDTKS